MHCLFLPTKAYNRIPAKPEAEPEAVARQGDPTVRHGSFPGGRWIVSLTGALLFWTAGPSLAQDDTDELRALYEKQAKELADLKDAINKQAAPAPAAGPSPTLDEMAVKQIIAGYLQDNPGAGVPAGVQAGYKWGSGFSIASPPNPKYANWDDDSKIPFELRTRVRLQLAYYGYKVTDRTNHMTGVLAGANANQPNRLADFSQLEAKRVQLFFEGTAFDPDLRYHFRLHGDTRGLPGLQNNKVVQTAGAFDPNGSVVSPIGGGVTIDHAVRLFEAWVAYDMHPCWSQKGCAADCPDGSYLYTPTYTIIAGKMKPFFGLEEILGNQNEQFVEFNMADLFFDADGDNRLMAAGVMVKALEDRFFMQAILTNGNENLFANSQLDQYPGFISGVWYDLGGSWDADRKAWNLFGDCISDIDYSCKPVARVGGCVNIVPMGRRSLYGDAEQSRVFTMSGGPGGTRLINLLNGDGATATPVGGHAVDMFDAYSFNTFWAAKYRGFSVLNEWWFRDLNNFRTTPSGRGDIIYTSNFGNSLFPANRGLFDYGMSLQAGYFIIPKKLEVAVRWAWINGQSGDINGNGRSTLVTVPGVAGPVRVVDGAFRNYHTANEYTIGLSYYFKRHLLKWQTDFSIYDGGNPAGEGSSIAGWVAGSDGYMLRSQIQLLF
jgi:hypothetical protein